MLARETNQRLESWKEIASYLGRTVRTVQRWEASEGLPVRRQLHQSLGNVYAFPEELDRWMSHREEGPAATALPQPKSRRWIIPAAFVGVLIAAAGGWLIARSVRPSEPSWLLVTELVNRTGEPLLDESVTFLLERELSNSSGLYVAPRARIEDSLRLMRKDPGTRVDEALGREVAIRDGGIRLVVSSRAERTGSAFLMTGSVIDAASGRLLGGASEQARTVEEIALAVRRLASAVRRVAGDPTIGRATKQGLEHVTTPSLRACQLYSQAYRLATGTQDWRTAERLSRDAIAEDPQFASAHMWLAWAIHNQKRPEAEWRESLARAVAFSNFATDRERQFIFGSEKTLQPDFEAAVTLWRRMLTLYPDDYWARNNLVADLRRLGRTTEADMEIRRMADLRPNDPLALNRALDAALLDSNLQDARKYTDRLSAMVQSDPDLILNWVVRMTTRASIEAFPLHSLWAEEKLDQVQARIRRVSVKRPVDFVEMRSNESFHWTLGRLRDAELYLGETTFAERGEVLVWTAYLRDDPATLEVRLREIQPPQGWGSLLWVRRDTKLTELDEIVAHDDVHRPLYEARIAAFKGDGVTAAENLDGYFRRVYPGSMVGYPPLISKALLARAYELAGDDAAALRSLQAADYGRVPLFRNATSSGSFWHRIRYDEARILRKLGRQKEAEPIEAALRRDLRLADPDHPILVRLSESSRRPFNVY